MFNKYQLLRLFLVTLAALPAFLATFRTPADSLAVLIAVVAEIPAAWHCLLCNN